MNNAKPQIRIRILTRTIVIGNESYTLPLNQNGYYVSDSNGKTIMECGSINIAQEMLKLLNNQTV